MGYNISQSEYNGKKVNKVKKSNFPTLAFRIMFAMLCRNGNQL